MKSGQAYLLMDDRTLLAQCDVDRYRSHGPGGQKRNKTSSAVRLRHRPTGLMAIGVEDRSQHVNKARALRRLRATIALSVRSAIEPGEYRRSELLGRYTTATGRLRVALRNPEYHRIISEVLDVFTMFGLRVSPTAERIGLSTSQLAHFFQRDPKLWRQVNQMRSEAGLRQLHA